MEKKVERDNKTQRITLEDYNNLVAASEQTGFTRPKLISMALEMYFDSEEFKKLKDFYMSFVKKK